VRGLKNSSLYGETFFLLAGRWVLPVGGYCMVAVLALLDIEVLITSLWGKIIES
jgi:hypothetical protein